MMRRRLKEIRVRIYRNVVAVQSLQSYEISFIQTNGGSAPYIGGAAVCFR